MTNLIQNPVHFYRIPDPYGVFCNFSRHVIKVEVEDEVLIGRTNEHLFQAWKFFTTDMNWAREILLTAKPMNAAGMGRSREHPLRSDWEDIKDDVMRLCVVSKVMQHEDVKATLASTGERYIAEHTANDFYWGDGLDGSGKNMLGTIYMEVREATKTLGTLQDYSEDVRTRL